MYGSQTGGDWKPRRSDWREGCLRAALLPEQAGRQPHQYGSMASLVAIDGDDDRWRWLIDECLATLEDDNLSCPINSSTLLCVCVCVCGERALGFWDGAAAFVCVGCVWSSIPTAAAERVDPS
eukprot:GHVU01103665.1.p1 GENE.GHVU01103665.1~~GHVU01103665.1.p1  ORF type:complete len:123 (-),score=22.68 GHVU01103665.1:816-1184(-)